LQEGVWNAVVIFRLIKARGYTGRLTILRDYIQPKRPLREGRSTVRFETAPGKQMQNDWAEVMTVVAGSPTKVHFTVNTLGFWCTDREDAEHTYEGIEYFGGVTEEVMVDNQKTTVIEHRKGRRVKFNEGFLDLADHYGFVPRACRPYRARTKGYREFDSFAHMNQLALRWLEGSTARSRSWSWSVFRGSCPIWPLCPGDTSYREYRFVHWDGYIDVRGNRYSVPAELCGQKVDIRIGLDGQLSVYADDVLVARHRASEIPGKAG